MRPKEASLMVCAWGLGTFCSAQPLHQELPDHIQASCSRDRCNVRGYPLPEPRETWLSTHAEQAASF